MKQQFVISGCFYQLAGLKCRKYLDIKRKETALKTPDLLVVMMNPGNSEPLDGMYTGREKSEARPDRTQLQIMRLMNECDLSYCRILNLTDIQEPNSNALYGILSRRKTKKLAHSIFDPRRRAEFDELYPIGTRTVFAWGVHDALSQLARRALDRIGEQNSFGFKKEDSETAFYHPLPPNFYKQKDWVNQVSKQIRNNQQLIKT